MPGRLPHCRCLNSSLLHPNGAANGRKDHRQQQAALFILMAPAQQQARGNYSRPPRQKPQQGTQPAVGLRADKYRRWAICSANNANGAVGLRSPCLHPVFQLVPKLAHDLPCLSFVVWPLHGSCLVSYTIACHAVFVNETLKSQHPSIFLPRKTAPHAAVDSMRGGNYGFSSSKDHSRPLYSSLISSTLVSRGLPGQQASAKADSARNWMSSSFRMPFRSAGMPTSALSFLTAAIVASAASTSFISSMPVTPIALPTAR